ncbi:phasin family protein [Marinobacterium weihaiense]|uniref:Phasin family protein n=1 Tax=Marinobacterium weihaiense TaxID=2851016 RepID=A0ABS6M693_9GAMM|nr:phasin family protein [Marinobacterium weihaiense]MBV0931788.1 phasin family protein [Marinobacterium weihaiense]
MYDNMLKEMQDKMKPVADLAEANRKAAEKIFALQSAFFTDSVNAGLAQVKALSEVKEPKEVFELQMSFIKSQEAKWTDTAEQELAALNEVREEASALFEQSLSSLGDMSYMTKFEMPSFDMKGLDFSSFMPKTDDESKKPAATNAKPATRKSNSASAAATA